MVRVTDPRVPRLTDLKRPNGEVRRSKRLDVSRRTIVSIEKGKYDPSLPLAFRIATLFGQRIEDIFEPGDEDLAG